MLIDDGIMIAGMNSKTLNINAYILPDELYDLRTRRLSGPLVWPAYLFVELINIKVDDEAIKNGETIAYKGCTYFLYVDRKFEPDFQEHGKVTIEFSPLGNVIELYDVTKMDMDNKLYRHFLNRCMEDVKKGKKPNYDGLDKRKSLNTFLDAYRYLIPRDGNNAGKAPGNLVSLEDSLKELRRINTTFHND